MPARPSLTDLISEITVEQPQPDTEPANRAARRGKAKNQAAAADRHHGSAGHARPAQGRRINPVRRTG